MAAHSNNVIRLRLYFDYPPPAVTGHRMCWVLVDLNTCRVVADLESIIREKFELSRRSILNLFIEDCYLPHTESIYVVRDNDNVRVEVDCLPQVNGHSVCFETASENCRKRQRAGEEEEEGLRNNGVNVEWTKKKKKKRTEEETEIPKQILGEDKNKKSQEKQVQKTKKKKKADENVTPKAAASNKKRIDLVSKSTKKPQAVQAKAKKGASSDSSSSSSSEEDEAPKKIAPKTPTSTPTASKINTKPPLKKKKPSSSSSSSDSSSDEATNVKVQPKNKHIPKAPSVQQSVTCAQKQAVSEVEPPQEKVSVPHKSDSEEEIQLIIKRPLPQNSIAARSQSAWCGRGRGKPGHRGGGGQRGRGAVQWDCGSVESRFNGDEEQSSYQTDSLTNKSVILQNGTESAPKQDYSSMPLLAAPPQVGQKVAFKLLELTENYTPEVSEYKEGQIVSFDPASRHIELELLNVSHAPVAPGKFDLVYQNPDGSERVEYTVSRESRVTERWESLLEPRLII